MKYIIGFVIFTTVFLFLNISVKAQDEIIFFHSDTCPYCTEVLEVIEENDLEEVLNIKIIERNDEGFSEIFIKSLEDCGMDPDRGGFPTLYHNGECSVGKINAVDTLLALAGIEVLDEEMEEDEVDVDEDMTVIEEEEREVFPLEIQEFEREPRPITHILMIIIGPALLIGLGYYMIKKLNL